MSQINFTEGFMEKLVERVIAVLTAPKDTWDVIKAEEQDQLTIIKNYLLYLAAIPAVASFIGRVIIGTTDIVTRASIRIPFFSGLLWAVFSFVLTIVGVYLSAIVISALASNFGGTKNDAAAFRLVAYAYTAPLVAGIFYLLPSLNILATLGGLYGIYLLYLGLPVLMETPKEKALGFTVVAVLALVVIYAVMGGLAALTL